MLSRRGFLRALIAAPIVAALPVLLPKPRPRPQFDAIQELCRALESGSYKSGFPGTALRVESLEATMRVVTFDDNHIRLWRST